MVGLEFTLKPVRDSLKAVLHQSARLTVRCPGELLVSASSLPGRLIDLQIVEISTTSNYAWFRH